MNPIASSLRRALPVVAGLCAFVAAAQPVTRARSPVDLPEIPGFVMIKGDFHIHTVFSDGLVWPTVRVDEAWREGLDAVAITDHVEYQPHKADLGTNLNRSYEIARGRGGELDLLVVRGSEITRKMPPGHLNAIFITNAASLVFTNWRESVQAASAQGAFLFWNHPAWDAQTTNGRVVWYPEHTELLERGLLHGIEVVNGRDYSPEAHRWAVGKKLTMLSNSDIHDPLNMDYLVHQGDHRPMTLVFAKDRTPEALRQALFARQTVVYTGDRLIGGEELLRPLFTGSVRVENPKVILKGKQRVWVRIYNRSEVDLRLERQAELADVSFPKEIVLAGRRTVLLGLTGKSTALEGSRRLRLPYKAMNLLAGPDEPLSVTLDVEAEFVATAAKTKPRPAARR